ncbi:MAG: restriction endonuclease subunit S [Cyanobacteria bacterium J06621_11]
MELLEKHFETAFDAPDGIEKLRELILTLALQGKLVKQDSEDQSAQDLLSRLRKARLDKYKHQTSNSSEAKTMLRKLSKLDILNSTNNLPTHWVTTHLIDCCEYLVDCHNKTATYTESGIPIIRTTNIRDRQIRHQGMKYISKDTYDFWSRRCPPQSGDIIFTREAPMGEATIIPENMMCCLGQRTMLIRPMKEFIDPRYLLFSLTEPSLLKKAAAGAIGSTVKHLRVGDVERLEISLPPLPEQCRIVAKIDQLMARCDELEKLRTERDRKRLTVHTAALNRLLTAQTRDTSTDAWQFIAQHFGELYAVKENVAELRKAILQLAVMGKLVAQDPSDEPANVLLKAIETEKQRLIKEKKTRKPKPLPELLPEDLPVSIPNSWEWVRFEDIVDIGSGVTKGRKLQNRTLISLPYLRVANVQRGYLNLKVMKEIEIPEDEVDKYALQKEDLLITEGGDWDKVGRTAIWNSEIPECIHQNHVFKARRYLQKQNIFWLEKFLNSTIARTYFAGASKQTTNLASINKTQLRGCPIPIPPLPEQHRIVAKVDQLMALCDTLEQQIDNATHKQTALLNAVMAQV